MNEPDPPINGTVEFVFTDLVDPLLEIIDHDVNNASYMILPMAHDLSLNNMIPMKSIIGLGYSLKINMSVANEGSVEESTFVLIFANSTLIGNHTVQSMLGGTVITFIVQTDTSSLIYGIYNISAYVSTVPYEMNTTDNSLAGYFVVVTIPGDLNGDFKVALVDLVTLASAYGSRPDEPKWETNADIDGNDVVGLSDLVILAAHYGQHYP
jgi:hypothetical protein